MLTIWSTQSEIVTVPFAASQSSLVTLGRRRSSSPAMAFAMPAHPLSHQERYGKRIR